METGSLPSEPLANARAETKRLRNQCVRADPCRGVVRMGRNHHFIRLGQFSHPLDPAANSAAMRVELTGYKVPSRWFVVEEFPLTPSGKIQKFALRENWENGMYREVDRG